MGRTCYDLGLDDLKREAEKLKKIEQEQRRRDQHRSETTQQRCSLGGIDAISPHTLKAMRQKYVDDWKKFVETPPNPMRIQDIPWPLGPNGNRFMLVNRMDMFESLREEQKRWHPDKFQQRYGKFLVSHEIEDALKRVIECAQSANAELDAVNE